jgi:hypothetical protein
MVDVLLDTTHALPGGRVRLRLPHVLDRPELHDLLARIGLEADDLEVRRGLRWMPGRRTAVCATRFDGMSDRIVGFASIEADGSRPTVIAEDRRVAALLERALADRASSGDSRVA